MPNKTFDIKSFFFALLIYLPSTALMPTPIYYIFAPVILMFFYKKILSNNDYLDMAYLFLFSCVISLSAFFYSGAELNFYGNFLPLQIGLLVSCICALLINKKVAKYLLLLIIFEFFIGYLQYYLNINTFFSFLSSSTSAVEHSSNLLYYKRVFGFSTNSSELAGKALICLVLLNLYFNSIKLKLKIFINILIFVTLIVTFSRSGLVAFLGYYALFFGRYFFNRKIIYALIIGLLALLLSYYLFDWSALLNQFTRGKGSVQLSGRGLIWFTYYEHIIQHILFGNFGIKNYLDTPEYGLMHAHNSFIMSLYLYGVIPLSIFALPLMIKLSIQPQKWLLLMPLIIYSMAQFVLFWGASFADIILFSVVFSKITDEKKLSTTYSYNDKMK